MRIYRRNVLARAALALVVAVAGLTAAPTVNAQSFTCFGVPATIVGTNGPDTLVGTKGRDVIVARRGHDQIRSLGGDDLICAGHGNDVIDAGGGDDRVEAGRGHDRVLGGPGADRVTGSFGNDDLSGGGGNDVLRGGAGRNDRADGQGGSDVCIAESVNPSSCEATTPPGSPLGLETLVGEIVEDPFDPDFFWNLHPFFSRPGFLNANRGYRNGGNLSLFRSRVEDATVIPGDVLVNAYVEQYPGDLIPNGVVVYTPGSAPRVWEVRLAITGRGLYDALFADPAFRAVVSDPEVQIGFNVDALNAWRRPYTAELSVSARHFFTGDLRFEGDVVCTWDEAMACRVA